MRYIIWRFGRGLGSYWVIVTRFSQYFGHILGIRLLFRTLFWPWKRDLGVSRRQGFDIKEWAGRHVFNLFSRFIGFLIKLFTLLLWAVWEIVWWAGALILFPIWILSPLVILGLLLNILAVTQNFTALDSNNLFVALGSVAVIILLIILETLAFKARRLSRLIEADYDNPDPESPWFISICTHLLVDQSTLKEAWINEKLKKILLSAHLSRPEFDEISTWEINRQIAAAHHDCWWDKANLFSQRPLTESWVFGWTFTLNNFSRDLTYHNDGSIALVNVKELEILKNSLAEGSGVNAAIVGESGTGRKRLVENLALDLGRRNVPAKLLGKKILEFRLDNLIASSGSEEDRIYLLEKALAEACTAGNIILFVPTFQNYLDVDPQESKIGEVDITPVLTNFLENAGIQIITCAAQAEITSLFQAHTNLAKYFKIINLSEPDLEECLLLLCEKAAKLENKFGRLITYGAVKKALELSDRYFQEIAMPKRALDFLEEAVSYFNTKKALSFVKDTDISDFASSKLGSPVGELNSKEKEKLLNLEAEMQKLIIGQDEAVKAVASALRRRRLDLSNPTRPAGCFLFLGSTGVGKTHTAEVLAKLYFDGESRIARLDMSEYRESDAITRLLGDASGKTTGYLQKILSANPFNLVLLDELEKASREVHQLLLQIMEEGIIKTGTGKKLNFRETIVIATSNAEAMLVQELVKKQEPYELLEKRIVDQIQQDGIFSPEILNRFDEIIVFHPLEQSELYQIAALALSELKKRLLNKEIVVGYSEDFIRRLAESGFNPTFGARELRRMVEKQIEDAIAKDLLAEKIVKGKEYLLPLTYLK
jgi:ATP-dependent Clp protease ATP-binding subunit ClpC